MESGYFFFFIYIDFRIQSHPERLIIRINKSSHTACSPYTGRQDDCLPLLTITQRKEEKMCQSGTNGIQQKREMKQKISHPSRNRIEFRVIIFPKNTAFRNVDCLDESCVHPSLTTHICACRHTPLLLFSGHKKGWLATSQHTPI